MAYQPATDLPFIEEHEATGEVAVLYDAFKREFQSPIVPNIVKGLSGSPEVMGVFKELWRGLDFSLTIPHSLMSMISYTIARKNECVYCSVNHELTCRTLGVDEATLEKLSEDLGSVNPLRLQAIIEFAVKVAKYPQSLERADYDKVRDQGVTDSELVEVIFISATSVLLDILAEALQIEVEEITTAALAEMN